MTRLPSPVARSYRSVAPGFGPWSIAGLLERWPVSEGDQYQDSLKTILAGAGDPVGALPGLVSGIDLVQPTTSKKPTFDQDGPALRHDMVDDLLQATYELSMASRWAVGMALWARDDTDRFEAQALGVPGLDAAGEEGVRFEPGDNLQVALPANWNPNSWSISGWMRPDFAYDNGSTHFMLWIQLDANNRIYVRKVDTNAIRFTTVAGGVTNSVDITVPFTAGDAVFFGLRFDGTDVHAYADADGDDDLVDDVAVIAGAGAFAAGSYAAWIGQQNSLANHFEGALNLLVTNDGSDASGITDRFAAGAGMPLAGPDQWLGRHGHGLVLHLGADAAGSGYQLDSAAGGVDLLADADTTGRYDFQGAPNGYLTTIDPGAGADGLSATTWAVEYEVKAATDGGRILGRWDAGVDRQFLLQQRATGVRVFIASSGADASNFVDFAVPGWAVGKRYWLVVTFAGGAVALGARERDPVTRTYGPATTPAGAVTGAIPATLRTSALGYELGSSLGGGAALAAYVDDVRISNGLALSLAQVNAETVPEANPAVWDYWWPMDGGGNDQVAGLTFSPGGTVMQVGDGRKHRGEFSRWTKQGQYLFDGVNDEISLGNWTVLDGASAFSMFGVFTPGKNTGAPHTLFARYDPAGNRRQVLVDYDSTAPFLRVAVDDDGAGAAFATGDTPLVRGTKYAFWIRYDGAGVGNTDKLKMGLAAFDPATGTYGAFSEETLAFTGTAVPASLTTPGASVTAYFGRTTGGSYLHGLLDEFRLEPTALDVATLNAATVYTSPTWTYRWAFNGNAAPSGSGPTGTVSGATSWYDGRQPAGWTQNVAGETDRMTGGAVRGTWRLRLKGARWDRSGSVALQTGRWSMLRAWGEEPVGGLGATINNGMTGPNFLSAPAYYGTGYLRTGTSASHIVLVTAETGEGDLDDLQALELAVLTPTVATKAVPTRVIWSASRAGEDRPYLYVALASDEKLEIGARNEAGARTEASSPSSLVTGAHSLILEHDGAGTLRAYVDAELVATLALAGTFSGLDRLSLGGLAAYLEGHPFDERIGDSWMHAGPDFAGYTAIQRARLHNYLAARTTGLAPA